MPKAIAICEYCNAANQAGTDNCLACGAPLPQTTPPTPTLNISRSDRLAVQSLSKPDLQDARQAGERIENAAYTLLGAYSIIWRTLAEVVVIAITAFGLGVIGGATEMTVFGIISAAILGLLVGAVEKNFYFTLFGPPVGMLIGAAICSILWVIGIPPKVYVFVFLGTTGLAALPGSYRPPFTAHNWWGRLRPVLGLLGGLAFGLLGGTVGFGLRAAINALIGGAP